MKVDGSIGSLLQGVSQQPARDRLDGQCTLQENMSANPVHGLMRRPPTDLVGFLGSASNVNGWHNFQTRDGKKFLAMFRTDTVKVFDFNATEQSVTVAPDAVGYLGGSPIIKCSTDDRDVTLALNPAISVSMNVSPATYFNAGGTGGAIVQVLGGAYGHTYSIFINGVLYASYRPPDGTGSNDSAYGTTKNIATRLAQGLVVGSGITHPDGPTSELNGTGGLATGGWGVTQFDDLILIQTSTGSVRISVSDGAGGVNMKACSETVTKVSDLPRFAPHLYAIRIAENSDPGKDLWFKFIANAYAGSTIPTSAGFGQEGYWTETIAPGVDAELNNGTLPHSLTYLNPGFSFARTTYNSRGVGTLVSNPNPSFIGNRINDVTTFQGRTVFLSGSNVIMSRTNKPYHFWRGSASALVDTDPIDVNSTVESSQMLAAVQFNKDLALFTPKAQHVIFGRNALTPMNAALVMTTKFESEQNAHPVAAGRNIFFASSFGRFTGIREFFAEAAADRNDSRPVTQHVNEYITGRAQRLTASANYETLLVHTEANRTDVYLYQYIWEDEKKVQAAWSVWKFNREIVYSFFDAHTLYLVQRVDDDYYLLRAPLDVQDSVSVGYPIYLDERFDVFGCYSSFVLPYSYMNQSRLVCVQGSGCPTPGMPVGIKSIAFVAGTGYVVTLNKNMNGGHIVVGTKFLSRYMPTMQRVKDQSGIVIGTAKQRAKHFIVSLSETGYIAGRARSKYGDGPEVTFNARIVGDVDNTVGEQPLSDGTFIMPFRHDVTEAEIEFYTDSHLPMTMVEIEYVGQYNKRGRRIANPRGGN